MRERGQDWRPTLTRGAQDRFLFVGERLCLDFVNTRVVAHDQLVDLLQGFRDWVEWSLKAKALNPGQARKALGRWSGSREAVDALEVAKVFRETLRAAVEHIATDGKVPENAIIRINAALRHPAYYSSLERSREGLEVRRHLAFDEPIGLLVPVAESAADLLSCKDLSLIKKCDNSACVLYFYDTTKNHRRRWCSTSLCGNRMKVAAFYRRHRKTKR